MGIWGRIAVTLYSARAAWAAYNQRDELGRLVSDAYANRLFEYALYDAYYDNSAYDSLNAFSAALKAKEKLYRHIAGIYNPVKRENELYVANVFQGMLNPKALGEGALPLQYDNPAYDRALPVLYRWSNLGQQLGRYTKHAALYGTAFWWVVDDPERERVRLELLHPSKVREVERDEVGHIKAAVIEYERTDAGPVTTYTPGKGGGSSRTPAAQPWLYTLKITKRDEDDDDEDGSTATSDGDVHFQEFRDGEPYNEWYAPYGFVPLRDAPFELGDDGWGRNSFYASRLKIDSLNDQASIVNATIRRVIEPLLKAKGTRKGADELDVESRTHDGLTIVYLPGEKQDLEAVQIPIDLQSAAANVRALLDEIERDMSLLALQRIREQVALTAPGVRVGYSDAISKVIALRGNLDPGICAALKMACSIAAWRGYDDFRGFDLGSFDAGDMELTVAERVVIPDTMSSNEKIQALAVAATLPLSMTNQALKEMGLSPSTVESIMTDLKTEREREELQQLLSGLPTTTDTNTDGNPNPAATDGANGANPAPERRPVATADA